MNCFSNFFGLFPLALADDELYELPCDMICSSEETAKYMVGELNAGRFWNVPSFQGINCNSMGWVYKKLNSHAGVLGFTAWFDPYSVAVYTAKPAFIQTYKIVLHHHYADGLIKGIKLVC